MRHEFRMDNEGDCSECGDGPEAWAHQGPWAILHPPPTLDPIGQALAMGLLTETGKDEQGTYYQAPPTEPPSGTAYVELADDWGTVWPPEHP